MYDLYLTQVTVLDKWIAKAELIKAQRSCSTKSAGSPLSKNSSLPDTSCNNFNIPTDDEYTRRTNFARLQIYLEFKHVSDEGPTSQPWL